MTEEPRPEYDRWSRPPALSNRGYFLVVLVPLLLAALGFGIVSLVSAGDETASGTTVRLPLSGWQQGDPGGDAVLQGVLKVDADHCVYLEAGQDGDQPGRVYAVWPAGFRARLDEGRLSLRDGDGDQVAQNGDRLSTSGGYGPAGTFAGEPCLPQAGRVWIVQSEVQVTE